jgi:hypothetical protein
MDFYVALAALPIKGVKIEPASLADGAMDSDGGRA